MPIKIFGDGADLATMREQAAGDLVSGWTTNPTLMRRAGVTDYRAFAREVLTMAGTRPVSFEVLADDLPTIRRQALVISSWGANAFVKVPIMLTDRTPTVGLVAELAASGVPLNVTAVFTARQVGVVGQALGAGTGPAIVSMFAGRIADAGHSPVGYVGACRKLLANDHPRVQMLWASPRQVGDVKNAELAGCDIITLTPDLIAKLPLIGKDLEEFSRETVQMFYEDAQASGLEL